jgi:hypothetical protein
MRSGSQVERILMFDLATGPGGATTLPRAQELRQQTDTAYIARRNREPARRERQHLARGVELTRRIKPERVGT